MIGIGINLEVRKTSMTSPPEWWNENAVLSADFTDDRYMVDGMVTGQAGFLDTARASTAYTEDISGNWVSFAANQPRITNKGLLVEPVATNYVNASNFAGAAIGVVGSGGSLPNGWTTGNLDSIEVLDLGTENGLPYMEFRAIRDNPGTGGNYYSMTTNTNTPTDFDSPDTIFASVFIKKISGNFDVSTTAPRIQYILDGANGTKYPTISYLTATMGVLERLSDSLLLARDAPVTATVNLLQGSAFQGDLLDIVMRVYAPQVEKDRLSSPNINAGTSSTRQADVIRADDIATVLSGMTRAIIVLDLEIQTAYSDQNHPRMLEISDGTSDNFIAFLREPSSGDYSIVIRDENVDVEGDMGATAPGRYRVAFGIESDGSASASLNGNSTISMSTGLADLSLFSQCNIGSRNAAIVEDTLIIRSIEIIDADPTPSVLEALSAI